MDFWATTVLTAIALGSVIFIIAVGLSLVMGLMGVLNLAHGALVMVGAYMVFTCSRLAPVIGWQR